MRFIEDDGAGYYAVQVFLSGLRASNRKPHFINIAAKTFYNLLNKFDVTLFKMDNTDLVLLCKDVPVEEIDPAMHKARQLFGEDPLTDSDDVSIDDRFSTWYDLVQQGDYSAFIEIITRLTEEAIERQRMHKELLSPNALPGERMQPKDLAGITLRLQTVEINYLISEKAAAVIRPGAKWAILFCEQYVTMKALQKRVAPDENFFGLSWLFQNLTEAIDRRLLN